MKPGNWQLVKWNGIPVFLHWSVFLWLVWYWVRYHDVVWAGITFIAYFVLLAAHELGHAAAARSRGVRVYAIRLFLFHGVCEHQEPYHEEDDVFIAWGGVLAQVCILVLALAVKYTGRAFLPESEHVLQPLLIVFIDVNTFTCLFNLLPVAPLDGYKAWRAISLLRISLLPSLRNKAQSFSDALNFRKRRRMAKNSKLAVDELLKRLQKK